MTGPGPHRLPARVDFETAPAVLEAAGRALAGGAREFDLADCRRFDSALLAVLLELSRRVAAAPAPRDAPAGAAPASAAGSGAPVSVCRVLNVPPNLRKLAALYGVDELLFEQRD